MAWDPENALSRTEEILYDTINGIEYSGVPRSRVEELLLELKAVIEAGGGGGGETNYNLLTHRPSIWNDETEAYVRLKEEMKLRDLGIKPLTDEQKDALIALLND